MIQKSFQIGYIYQDVYSQMENIQVEIVTNLIFSCKNISKI